MTADYALTNPLKHPANIFTVDVEDWYQGISRYVEAKYPTPRLPRSLPLILDLLKKYKATATFFVLGEVAAQYPELVKRIAAEGHEVGCHGFSHRHIEELGAKTFNAELIKSTKLLESICGTRVLSFRAPLFSVTKSTFWALNIVKKNGYAFDSSIFPTYHPFYGIPNAPTQPHPISLYGKIGAGSGSDSIIEFPVLTRKLLGVNVPVGGGAYLRFLGQSLLMNSVTMMNLKGWPATLYIHPWELDSYIPNVSFNPAIRFITFHNHEKTATYLETVLKAFRFVSIRDYVWRQAG
jgi:peptidoglycan-N-acetylglucosamine deacetylase